ncbi:DUF6029 family protein [Carboxylicivirga sp. M1479]|uniref:DUF6029 family protein n=1 Tax=Carboxylicivirga sp. M1479 TaxID=2594476 RepID=UPI0011775575|nr:DUF6029 family protein [Carboxylicivirga sp. M1479]TRX66155.1 hypothetical protein FNN09_15260 [Carboxylicivirga sp. M1479]
MRKQLLIFVFLLFGIQLTRAQFSGSSLLEYQYGQLPTTNETSFNALYNKVNLNYRYQKLKAKAGVQYFVSPYSDRNYIETGWFGLNYRNKGWDFNLGNFNETIGRGILLRSYEIHGAVIEDISYRSKQYFYRDIMGASAAYRHKKFALKTTYGYVLNNLVSPTEDWQKRRDDEIMALSAEYKLLKQTIGGSYMHLNNSSGTTDYALGSLSGRLFPFMNYYTTYASTVNNEAKGFAFYGSLNFSINKLGISAEYKHYENFVIGSGINEPPALVKEHSYRVLNRSTHVVQPENEYGFQLEAFYQATDKTLITFNYTQANNDLGSILTYTEYFAELSTTLNKTDVKFFADYANDPLKGESDRISTGTNIDQIINAKQGLLLELEFQNFKRDQQSSSNYVVGLNYRYDSKLFAGILNEWSDDEYITSTPKLWLSGTVRYKLNNKHTVQVFAGERRGGPACSAGVCYEVLDFKGVELRWNARF